MESLTLVRKGKLKYSCAIKPRGLRIAKYELLTDDDNEVWYAYGKDGNIKVTGKSIGEVLNALIAMNPDRKYSTDTLKGVADAAE